MFPPLSFVTFHSLPSSFHPPFLSLPLHTLHPYPLRSPSLCLGLILRLCGSISFPGFALTVATFHEWPFAPTKSLSSVSQTPDPSSAGPIQTHELQAKRSLQSESKHCTCALACPVCLFLSPFLFGLCASALSFFDCLRACVCGLLLFFAPPPFRVF